MRRYDFITFDCYGTLIDWRSGIAAAFESYARSRGLAFERDAVLDAYIAVEHEVESGSYRSYREVLRETARRIASQVGWNVSRDDASFLPDSLPSWQPFPDMNAALEMSFRSSRFGDIGIRPSETGSVARESPL